MECNVQRNLSLCTCTYEPCERKGRCCECIQYHKQANQLPGCLFSAKAERTYDRSIAKFISSIRG